MKEIFTSACYADLSRKIDEFMENHEVYSWDNVTIVTEKKPTDDSEDYCWEATLMPKGTKPALIDMLGGATEMAIKIKGKLVEMAIDCSLPVDMTELDHSIISDIIEGNLKPEQ